MAAQIIINEWNGSAGSQASTPKTGSTIRFKSADDSAVNNSNPMVKPNAGAYRSYEKWLRASIQDLDDATNISNIEVFVAGTPNTGVSIWASTQEEYCATNGSPRSGGYSSANAMPQPKENLFTYTSANPLLLGEGPFTEDTDGGVGNFFVLQMEVLPSASVGTTRSYSLILRYDEE